MYADILSRKQQLHNRIDNESRFLSCLVYPESGCFTGFPWYQSFLVLKSSVRSVVNVVNLWSKNDEMESANKMKLKYTNVNGYLIPNLTYKSGEQME